MMSAATCDLYACLRLGFWVLRSVSSAGLLEGIFTLWIFWVFFQYFLVFQRFGREAALSFGHISSFPFIIFWMYIIFLKR